MKPYKENKLVGMEYIPIQVYKIDMNEYIGVNTETLELFSSETTKNSYDYSTVIPQWHSYIEILHFTKGSAIVQINNEHFKASKGDIVLIDSFDIHSIKGNSSHTVILINTSQMDMINAFNLFPSKLRDKWLKASSSEKWIIDNLLNNINNILSMYENKPPGYHFKIFSNIYDILGDLILYTSKITNEKKAKKHVNKGELEKLQLALSYIYENYSEPISLNKISSIMNFSPNYFCRFFKKNLGKTFFEYINYYRCSKAELLLNTTSKNISEIALDVGFNSVSYFDKVYKKYKGYSPSTNKNNLK